jgi:hypothetical protein
MNKEGIARKEDKDIVNPMERGMAEDGKTKTLLEMSLVDHQRMASSLGESELDLRMRENPEKTLGELMTDTEVKEFLDKQIEHLKIMGGMARRVEASEVEQNLFLEGRKDFEQMVEYLDKLGKLPADFEDGKI